jgi:hypothetical protein
LKLGEGSLDAVAYFKGGVWEIIRDEWVNWNPEKQVFKPFDGKGYFR